MGQLSFYDKLNSLDDKEFMEMFLLYAISPVISKLKPASTITIKKNNALLYNRWQKYGKDFLKEIELEVVTLRENKSAVIVMIYDFNSIENSIKIQENKDFLEKLGYDILSVENCIEKLKTRYSKYNCPHELGVFLGIPIKDVKDFIDCSDKKCLMCGYWKVYNDFEIAKEMFDKYDSIKKHTMDKVLLGNKSIEIIYSIKEYFKQ
ncbi:MAG: DUF3793 family protein [Clostridioides sp.]|jgi:hypothetical protein|nr:DUF3793 family protein [Clostridioides sp.]